MRTTCISPYREAVLREFQRHKVPLNMDVEMPTVETIRRLVQDNEGVAFLPRMCVEQEIRQELLREIRVKELNIERKIPAGLSRPPRVEPCGEGISRSSKARQRRIGARPRLCWAASPRGRFTGTAGLTRARPSIAVAGAGIIGLSIAWRLAQRGFSVSVYDQGSVGAEASWAGAGMLSPGGEIDEPSELATLALESRRLYSSFVGRSGSFLGPQHRLPGVRRA